MGAGAGGVNPALLNNQMLLLNAMNGGASGGAAGAVNPALMPYLFNPMALQNLTAALGPAPVPVAGADPSLSAAVPALPALPAMPALPVLPGVLDGALPAVAAATTATLPPPPLAAVGSLDGAAAAAATASAASASAPAAAAGGGVGVGTDQLSAVFKELEDGIQRSRPDLEPLLATIRDNLARGQPLSQAVDALMAALDTPAPAPAPAPSAPAPVPAVALPPPPTAAVMPLNPALVPPPFGPYVFCCFLCLCFVSCV